MRYIALPLGYMRELTRVLFSDIPAYHKYLWVKTRINALSCVIAAITVHNVDLKNKLYHKELWHKGILKEVQWWEQWISTEEGLKWKNAVQDPQRLIQDYTLTDRISNLPYDPISILDVGSGPITGIGYTYPGRTLSITAVDPLANEYSRILKNASIISPVQTLLCHGEQLLHEFEAENFDFAYACNSLDHSYDPLLIIQNMLTLVKKDRFVLFRHYKNEGKVGKYHGLHQWNFDIKQDDFIIWNEAVEYNVTRILRDRAQIECYYERSTDHGVFNYNDWVVCIIKKL